jgi:hypothetical protein
VLSHDSEGQKDRVQKNNPIDTTEEGFQLEIQNAFQTNKQTNQKKSLITKEKIK